MKKPLHLAIVLLAALLLQACATSQRMESHQCTDGLIPSEHGCAPEGAVDDPYINELYERRTWRPQKEIGVDVVQLGADAEIPVNSAFGRIIGPTDKAARDSLVSKLYLIENAQHTVDVVYYIFTMDMVGYAVVGALCNAVQRGVDVRVMWDGTGSMATDKTSFRALTRCMDRAGFMRNDAGELTNRRARVQLVTFNAVTNFKGSPNRRSHDKLLVVDGAFDDKAYVMTGGRNISLAYYGITPDGEVDHHAYRDMEVLLRSDPDDEVDNDVGDVSAIYYTLLFLYRGNQPMYGSSSDQAQDIYRAELARAYEALRGLKQMELLKPHWDDMPNWTTSGFEQTRAVLVHELTNLDNKRVVRNAAENLKNNPNSVLFVMDQIQKHTGPQELSRIVSPYLFLAEYSDEDGQPIEDGAQAMLDYLDDNPTAEIEIITNSVLTSDNFSTQSIIDFDTAPRLLLSPEVRDAWLETDSAFERSTPLTRSDDWMAQVNHPRLRIYETGGLDSDYFGGDHVYGKLHSKFFYEGDIAYVGTNNFDYRSRLYNNEMGFMLQSEALVDDLDDAFDVLREKSVLWGSPEFLELRAKTMEIEGMKGWSTRNQRTIYKTLKKTGLHWLF